MNQEIQILVVLGIAAVLSCPVPQMPDDVVLIDHGDLVQKFDVGDVLHIEAHTDFLELVHDNIC